MFCNVNRSVAAVTVALVLAVAGASAQTANTPFPSFTLPNTTAQTDFTRLPRFFSNDPNYDAFVNEYFMRHLSVDYRGVYKYPIAPGLIDQLWTIEWDAWFLPWIDRGAMGLARQNGANVDTMLNTLVRTPVDKHGYAWGCVFIPEAPNVIGGHRATYCWPWPKYNWNRTSDLPTGWEFNDLADGARDKWVVRDMALEPDYVNHHLVGTVTGNKPEFISPAFDTDVFQVPIIELDITYSNLAQHKPADLVKGLRIFWTTDKSPKFSVDRMVSVNFSALPPAIYPEHYKAYMAAATSQRYPLYFPMYLHPKWGRSGRRITGLKIIPTVPGAAGVKIALNYVRASYDVRLSTSNSILVSAAARFFLWTGDKTFLRAVMPRLRRAMIFLNEHLQGKQEGLLNFDWMVGKDGLGGPNVGHGLIGSYWDLLPAGRYDLESSLSYYAALKYMAELERVVRDLKIKVPRVTVIGPDNKTRIRYQETSKSLTALAAKTKVAIEKTFWNLQTGRFVRNIDSTGRKHDYGFLHENLRTLACGVGTDQQRDSILSWLDGRVIEGDTATGKDIYKWRFAPRTTTRRNESYYFWPWIEGMPKNPIPTSFGNQVQDGGAVPHTSLLELIVRTRTGKQEQIDRAYKRTLEIRDWYADIKSAGGQGTEFYRTYYADHLERGLLQGGGPPGGLGLDREFLSDAGLGTTFIPLAFLGIRTEKNRVLSVTPALPTGVSKLGVENVFYRGNHLTIEAGPRYVSFEDSRITDAKGLKVEVTFIDPQGRDKVSAGGKRVRNVRKNPDGSVTVSLNLRPVRVQLDN